MDSLFTQFVFWALTAALLGLCAVLWKVSDRIISRMDRLEDGLGKKYDALKDEVHRDIGDLKVRVARVEGAVWPRSTADDSHR